MATMLGAANPPFRVQIPRPPAGRFLDPLPSTAAAGHHREGKGGSCMPDVPVRNGRQLSVSFKQAERLRRWRRFRCCSTERPWSGRQAGGGGNQARQGASIPRRPETLGMAPLTALAPLLSALLWRQTAPLPGAGAPVHPVVSHPASESPTARDGFLFVPNAQQQQRPEFHPKAASTTKPAKAPSTSPVCAHL